MQPSASVSAYHFISLKLVSLSTSLFSAVLPVYQRDASSVPGMGTLREDLRGRGEAQHTSQPHQAGHRACPQLPGKTVAGSSVASVVVPDYCISY